MYSVAIAAFLSLVQGPAAAEDPAFAKAAPACGAKAERVRAVAGFFELGAGQTIAEYQPDFVLTPCLAEAVRGRGRFIAVVEGGDRVEQVVRRVAVQKAMKREPGRYPGAPLVAIKAGKAVPAEHSGKVDRVLIAGSAADLLARPKRGIALLQALRELTGPAGLLGIVDVPDKGGIDVVKFTEIAKAAGWQPAGENSTAAGLLLKFRNG
jgi:hypothetical protein